MLNLNKNRKGFTLIEVLLVIAILGILFLIVIIAINPAQNLKSARDAQRKSNVNTILNATYQYEIDNNGSVPAAITTTPTDVCSTTGATCTTDSYIDLGVLTASEKYLVSIPIDPNCAHADDTCYQISKDANGRITVSAPLAETGSISVTR